MAKITTVSYDSISIEGFAEVWFAVGPRGLWRTDFGGSRMQFLERLYHDGVTAVQDKMATAAARRSLTDYFAGKSRTFGLKIDWSRVDGFVRKALQVCARIPYGRMMSYGEIAARAGNPGAARAVGGAMGKNPFPLVVPCHRVIKSDGSIGGYSGGLHYKRFLLRREGIDPDAMPLGSR